MKIIRVSVSNFLRVSEAMVESSPDGFNVIGGDNGAGKSSMLRAMITALTGASKGMPDEPVNNKGDKGEVTVVLSSGHTCRYSQKTGGRPVFKITDKDGNKLSPADFLKTIVGSLAFDPVAFIRMNDKAQVDLYRSLLKIDFTALDEEYDRLFSRRTPLTTQGEALRELVTKWEVFTGLPEAPISISGLTEELQKAQTHNYEMRNLDRARVNALTMKAEKGKEIVNTQSRIKVLEDQLELARQMLAKQEDELMGIEQDIEEKTAAMADWKEIECDTIFNQINNAEEINRKIRSNKDRTDKANEYRKIYNEHVAITSRLKEIIAQKKEILANTNFPLKGVAFSEDGNCLTVDGIPFSQLSSALQLKVAVALGFTQNAELKDIIIRDGAFLDHNSMLAIKDMVEQYDAQLWIERVGTDEFTTIEMIDGEVKNVN